MLVMETVSSNFAILYAVGAIVIVAAGYWHVHRADRELNELINNASDKPIDDLD